MEDLFDIQCIDKRLILNLKRPVEPTDFRIVSEVNNSIRFICDDEDNWEFLEVDHDTKNKKIWMATIKFRYAYADQLKEEILRIIKEENIVINPMHSISLTYLHRVYKTHLYTSDLKEESKTTLKEVCVSKEEEIKKDLVKDFTKELDLLKSMS